MENLPIGTLGPLEPVAPIEPTEPIFFNVLQPHFETKEPLVTGNKRIIEEMQKQAGGFNA
jgi:hypothetical protein